MIIRDTEQVFTISRVTHTFEVTKAFKAYHGGRPLIIHGTEQVFTISRVMHTFEVTKALQAFGRSILKQSMKND